MLRRAPSFRAVRLVPRPTSPSDSRGRAGTTFAGLPAVVEVCVRDDEIDPPLLPGARLTPAASGPLLRSIDSIERDAAGRRHARFVALLLVLELLVLLLFT